MVADLWVALSASVSVASVGSVHHSVGRYRCQVAGCSVALWEGDHTCCEVGGMGSVASYAIGGLGGIKVLWLA